MKPTSQLAYEQLKASGLLPKLQLEIAAVLAAGECTAGEVASRIAGKQLDSIRPRMAELASKGLVLALGERKCSITGRLAIVWGLSGSTEPAKVERNRPNREQALRHRIDELEQEAKRLRTENAALREKQARWGRPTDEERKRRALELGGSKETADLFLAILDNAKEIPCNG